MAGKLSKDYADSPQAAIRALMKCATVEEVEAFMHGEKRKPIQREAQALIAKFIAAADLPEMQIDKGEPAGAQVVAVGVEGEQPLDNTSIPRDKKAAKAVREQAAANRPHTKGVAKINPKSTKENSMERNFSILAQLNQKSTELFTNNLETIMESFDDGWNEAGRDEKYTHVFPITLRIVRDKTDFKVKFDASAVIKKRFSSSGDVHMPDPDNDFIDAAGAKDWE